MPNKFTLLFSLSFLFVGATAQQILSYDHYYYKPMLANPASTGDQGATNIMLLNRSQWTGFKGAPQLNLVSIDGSFKDEKVGVGGVLYSDKRGINTRTGASFLYAYRFKFGEETFLKFGLAAGIMQHSIDFSQSTVDDAADPILFQGNQSKTTFNADAGLAFLWKKLELGAGVNQLLNNGVAFADNVDTKLEYNRTQHYIGSLKYTFAILNKNLFVAPQAIARYVVNAPVQYEFNTVIDYKHIFWVGASYKNEYAISVYAGLRLHKQVTFGYAYDLIQDKALESASGLSHEIMINYTFLKKKEVKVQEFDNTENEQKIKENTEKIDSLKNEVEKNKLLLEDLEQRKEAAKITPIPAPVLAPEKTEGNGVVVVNNSVQDYIDENGKTPKPGIYVVVGTFFYRDFAVKFAEKVKKNGDASSAWVYSKSKTFNYVFKTTASSREDGLEKVEQAKKEGYENPWMLILTE